MRNTLAVGNENILELRFRNINCTVNINKTHIKPYETVLNRIDNMIKVTTGSLNVVSFLLVGANAKRRSFLYVFSALAAGLWCR